MRNLKIGYGSISKSFSTTQDRRRFGFWASKRKVKFEQADPSKPYDLIILTQMADLSRWVRYPYKHSKIVFDFVDSYLAIPSSDWRGLSRGIAKFIFRQNQYLHLDNRSLLIAMCQRSDAVVCATEEQKQEIMKYCPAVFINLDDQSEFSGNKKSDYECGPTFNLFWEGQGGNIWTFNCIRNAIEDIQHTHEIAIHMMTDLEYPMGLGSIGCCHANKTVKRILPKTNVYLYQWNPHTISALATACDMMVIPIPMDKPIYSSKAANKLLMSWRMGLPSVVSATPSYVREMQKAGIDNMSCFTTEEWIGVLKRLIEDKSAREQSGERGFAYVAHEYSSERILSKWDEIFASVLG